jgi:K(+)-stimulated pyrophosphate-energized sodium pump
LLRLFISGGGEIYAAIVPVKLVATIITIATGGSAGQVGPCGQIGATLSSVVADLFKLDENDRKKLVICGLSAGFAIGSAALTALAMFAAYTATVSTYPGFEKFTLDITEAHVIAGVFLGGILPCLIAAMTMTAVGDAAFDMVNEIRRQFREIPGIMEGKGTPDTNRCVDIATTASLKRMIVPGISAVVSPVLVGVFIGPHALGGFLAGATLTGVILGIFMANAGGAWDNAKKYIEKGNLGGKGSDPHKASVVGDTVGDPFKDTAGPCMNILIKVMSVVSVIFAPLFL